MVVSVGVTAINPQSVYEPPPPISRRIHLHEITIFSSQSRYMPTSINFEIAEIEKLTKTQQQQQQQTEKQANMIYDIKIIIIFRF